jgi:hypothetical protein
MQWLARELSEVSLLASFSVLIACLQSFKIECVRFSSSKGIDLSSFCIPANVLIDAMMSQASKEDKRWFQDFMCRGATKCGQELARSIAETSRCWYRYATSISP